MPSCPTYFHRFSREFCEFVNGYSDHQPGRNEEREDISLYLRALRFFLVDCNRSGELIRNVCGAELCAGAIRFGAILRDAFRPGAIVRGGIRPDEFRRGAIERDEIRRGLACLWL